MTATLQDAPCVRSNLEQVIRGDFNEMPGMRLTLPQVCRLWGLTPAAGEGIMGTMVACGFLVRDPSGRYCRRVDLP